MNEPAAYEEYEEEVSCVCCCAEHTFESCPARAAGHCRGQYTMTRVDYESWKKFYAKYHQIDLDTGMRIS